MLIANDVFLLL